MSMFAASTATQVIVEARVIRADGTVEELGEIAYWHANPLRRFVWRIRQYLRGRKPGRVVQR